MSRCNWCNKHIWFWQKSSPWKNEHNSCWHTKWHSFVKHLQRGLLRWEDFPEPDKNEFTLYMCPHAFNDLYLIRTREWEETYL